MGRRGGRRRPRRAVVVERVIAAPAARIFDVLADPAMHPVIDGSGSVRQAREDAPARLGPGARFGMSMRIGLPYRITNTVVEFEEGRRLAWRHLGRQVWRYQLEPVEGGTLVRETFDYTDALSPLALRLLRFPARNRRGMERTLDRLAAEVA
jgi:uncharacterized protein YndB with AHSA1/START domain